MRILVTGAKGFIGKNLIAELKHRGYMEIYEYDRGMEDAILHQYTRDCEFVYHLAGINRPLKEAEYMEGNYGFTMELLRKLKGFGNKAPILITSSIQAELNNPYGNSKKAGEDALFTYTQDTGCEAFVYRLPNVFGKWCRPNYNSVIATFCHNIARGEAITVNDPEVILKLTYIDDVVNEFITALEGKANRTGKYCYVPVTYTMALGKIAEWIYSFQKSREQRFIPDQGDEFVKKLYSTYLSCLPVNQFCYPLKMNADERGSFTEFIRTPDRGQISVNISKPGVTKGNHWHQTKNEKFLVVSGKAVIGLRNVNSGEVISCQVCGEKLEVVDIPPGYAHCITNIGDTELVTVMWANDTYSFEKPDTIFLNVLGE